MAQLRALEHSSVIIPTICIHETTPGVWEGSRASADRYTQPQKRTFIILMLCRRTVLSDWSKVVLRVMVDAAAEAGVLLADVDKIQKYVLLDTLRPLCGQAREMRKTAYQHGSTAGFISEEVDRVVSRYIYYLTHWDAADLKQGGELQGGVPASETVSSAN